MKATTVLCTLLVLVVVNAEWDWSKVKSFEPPRFRFYPNSRIVGGEEVVPHSYPHQVALFAKIGKGTYLCGGSVISRKFVLTAAHCVDEALKVEVILGAHNINQQEPTQKRYAPSNIKIHEKWNSKETINDIAVLELPEEIELNENIQIISLPNRSDVGNSLFGKLSTVSGWGRYSDKVGKSSDVLRHVETRVISNRLCKILYLGNIRSTNICTSGLAKKSTCGGDSGGPLVVEKKQVGIVSFGLRFGCELGWPAVFTRVTEYLDWIAANTDVIIN